MRYIDRPQGDIPQGSSMLPGSGSEDPPICFRQARYEIHSPWAAATGCV